MHDARCTAGGADDGEGGASGHHQKEKWVLLEHEQLQDTNLTYEYECFF